MTKHFICKKLKNLKVPFAHEMHLKIFYIKNINCPLQTTGMQYIFSNTQIYVPRIQYRTPASHEVPANQKYLRL